ncbi:MAG: SDR family oxidoreductase [Planctomycetota bacterium]
MSPETVLITGASSGIGLELARLFAADGCRLVLTARSEERLHQLADELREKHGSEVYILIEDLADPDAPQRLYDAVRVAGLEVDTLVNNAGFGGLEWFWKMPVERQRAMIEVNVASLAHLARLFLADMRERDRGGLLNVASTAAFVPGPHMATYYATKAFVLSLSEALREEHRRSGVSITCLCPGPTRTGFGADSGMGDTRLFEAAMPADAVARAGHRGCRRGKAIVVPGWRNKVSVFLPRLLPRFLVRYTVGLLQPIPAPHKKKR